MSENTPVEDLVLDDLANEIHETVLAAHRRWEAEDRHFRDSVGQAEHAAALDATIALLIRHRLTINADHTTHVVTSTQNPDTWRWARRCAEHIADIAAGSSAR